MANEKYIELHHINGNEITWRNMEGISKDSPYGREGVRYFAIKLDDDFAHEIENDEWPVIWRDVAPEGEEPIMQAYLKIFIKYGIPRYPVNIYMINRDMKSKTPIDEEDINLLHLDQIPIEFIDIKIRTYHWTFNNSQGVKAQLSKMNIMLAQDDFDNDYEIVRQY